MGLDRGGRGYLRPHFEAGQYGLICFFTDAASGSPHIAKGMALDFTVKSMWCGSWTETRGDRFLGERYLILKSRTMPFLAWESGIWGFGNRQIRA